MVKVIANCKCKCGKEFTKENKCYNRKEANSWKEYAEAQFDMCPECYKKQQTEKLMRGEVVEMKYSEYKNKYSDKKTIPDSYNATTKTILVVVKTAEEIKKEAAKIENTAKATKSDIFRAAHIMAKSMRKNNADLSYKDCLSIALKQCYTKVKEAKEYLAKIS